MLQDDSALPTFIAAYASCSNGSEEQRNLYMQFSLAAYAAVVADILSETIPKVLKKFFMTEVKVSKPSCDFFGNNLVLKYNILFIQTLIVFPSIKAI